MKQELSDKELELYSRHIMLDEIGIAGQEKLAQAKIIVIGVGGLGCPCLQYLTAAGIGEISICDYDKVELHNIQRQILFNESVIDEDKVTAAVLALKKINPQIKLNAINNKVSTENVDQLIKGHDLVIDACDNFTTRHVINQACVKNKINLIAGAAEKYDGQVFVFNFNELITPCYNCIFPLSADNDVESTPCAVLGVLAPLTGLIGSIMAAEAMRLIIGFSDKGLQSKMLSYDLLKQRINQVKLNTDEQCSVCQKS